MKFGLKHIFTLSALCFLATSCSITKQEHNETDDQVPLFGTEWKLEKIGSSKVKYNEENERITLLMTMEPENVSGFSGCNRYFGKFSIKKNKLVFKEMAATLMACPQQTMDFESKYLKTLDKVNNFIIENDTLFLKNDDRILLIFSN